MRVVLATGNLGKLREFADLLGPAGLEFEPLSAFGVDSPEETGQSFVENALLKARHAAACTGLPAMADDSGLEVDALGALRGAARQPCIARRRRERREAAARAARRAA